MIDLSLAWTWSASGWSSWVKISSARSHAWRAASASPAAKSRDIGLRAARIKVTALDDAPLSGRHVALLCVLAIAVTLDLMKPITLSFVAPGMAREYGLKSAASPHGGLPVSLLPLAAIVGTVVGSLVRGALADRIGRRASVLLAAMLFVTTGICGAMPGFIWNLLMCFVMGAAVGGMIPVAFALIGETVPARHRGWLMVLIGGPAGPTAPAFPARTREPEGFAQLLLRPFTGITLAASVLALGAGLVTYGFQLWIPTNLQRLGLGAVNSDYMIRDAALISLPVTLAAALLYGFWSSRKTIAVLSAVTVGSLLWFAVGGNSLARNHLLFSALLVIPLSGVSSVTAAIIAYACEIYPTRVRSRGTGMISGLTKASGVLIIGIVTVALTIPSISTTALIGIPPLFIATLIFFSGGTETSSRGLEEIASIAELPVRSRSR